VYHQIRDIAERCGVSERTVRAWIRAGELKAINLSRTPGSRRPRYRVTQAAIEAFEATRAAGVPAPRARGQKQSGDMVRFY
jgi:excisionase family DNA binding protein